MQGAGWGMSAAHRTSSPLQRWWRVCRWRRWWRTVETAAAAAAAVAASAVPAAAAAAAAPRLVGSGLRAVADGRSARGGGDQKDTCTREGGVRVRQREGARARPLGADGLEGRRAGRSPAMHPRHRRRQTSSWRRERLPGASPPLGDYPRLRRPCADGGPKPDGLCESILREQASMQLPGRSSDDVGEVSREGVPARRHEPTCASNPSNTMEMRWSTTLVPTRLPDC